MAASKKHVGGTLFSLPHLPFVVDSGPVTVVTIVLTAADEALSHVAGVR